jgi:hypothetical protein
MITVSGVVVMGRLEKGGVMGRRLIEFIVEQIGRQPKACLTNSLF